VSFFSLVFKEILRRRAAALVGLVAVACSIAVVVSVETMSRSSQKKIRKITKRMGNNLLIIPRDAEVEDYYAATGEQPEMPQSYVGTLANANAVFATDYLAKLQTRTLQDGMEVVLTGVLHVKGMKDEKRVVDAPKENEVYLGSEAAKRLGLEKGRTIRLGDRAFSVAKVHKEYGSIDDVRVYLPLEHLQNMLAKPGVIHGIDALECLCKGKLTQTIKQDVAKVLPEVRTVSFRKIASARSEARYVVEQFGLYIFITVVVLGGAAIAIQGAGDVMERRSEIGIFMAMGATPGRIAWIFLCKFFLIGLAGGLVGYGAGTWIAFAVGPGLLLVRSVEPLPVVFLAYSIGSGVLFAWLAAAYPVWKAAKLDPAEILRET